MNIKRLTGIAMSLVLAAGMLTGCGGKEAGKEEGGQAKGRYVEQEVELPFSADEEMLIDTVYRDDKIYMYTSSDQGDAVQHQSYVYENGTWSEPVKEEWLDDISNRWEMQMDRIIAGLDGKMYAKAISVSEDSAYGDHIFVRSEDGKTGEEITPEESLKVTKEDDFEYTDTFSDTEILKDGTLCLAGNYNDGIVGYKDGEKVFSLPSYQIISNHQELIYASDSKLLVVNEDGKSIDFYNTEDFKKDSSVDMEQECMEMHMAGGKDDQWYFLNDKGIQRIAEGGSIIETIMDGEEGMMSSEGVMCMAFFAADDNDFYAVYAGGQSGKPSLMHYEYDENIAAVPETTLHVYGVQKNSAVSQAVYQFNHEHPDVKVEYNTSVDEYDEVTSEDIRTLNTELLGGNDADVLILDELPLESYIDKGILADLSFMKDKLEKLNVCMNVVENTAVKDGKLYAVPARVGLPIMFGNQEAQDALKNMETLDKYMSENPQTKLFGLGIHGNLANGLFSVMYDDLIGEDGTMDEDKLSRLIGYWETICENAGVRELEDALDDSDSTANKMFTGFYSGEMSMLDMDDTESVFIDNLDGILSSMVPCEVMKQRGTLPVSIHGYYIPYAIGGICETSDQKELAEEFLLTLFSPEVQENSDSNGFPVTEEGYEAINDLLKKNDNVEEIASTSFTNPLTGESLSIQAGYPDVEMMEQIRKLIEEAEKPFLPDRTARDTFMEETEKCYEGTQSAEETAKAIVQKMDTYLSE